MEKEKCPFKPVYQVKNLEELKFLEEKVELLTRHIRSNCECPPLVSVIRRETGRSFNYGKEEREYTVDIVPFHNYSLGDIEISSNGTNVKTEIKKGLIKVCIEKSLYEIYQDSDTEKLKQHIDSEINRNF